MEASDPFETLVPIYEAKWRHIPEENIFILTAMEILDIINSCKSADKML
jgi:hypothetical protein